MFHRLPFANKTPHTTAHSQSPPPPAATTSYSPQRYSLPFIRNAIIALCFLIIGLFVLKNFITVLYQKEFKAYMKLSLNYDKALKEEQTLLSQLSQFSPSSSSDTSFLEHDRFKRDWKDIKLYEIPIVVITDTPQATSLLDATTTSHLGEVNLSK
ncbi:hypothetical protein COTS27_00175 [Spirochaetota bacterium]|nr:hypothetical protein COTS27_00175 [Spirochaetota bacterium]